MPSGRQYCAAALFIHRTICLPPDLDSNDKQIPVMDSLIASAPEINILFSEIHNPH